jgi:NAD-dependent deacetylase
MPGNTVSSFIDKIIETRNLVVLTGAGVSTDSGIPDFRSESGTYTRWDKNRVFDLNYFHSHPEYFWKYAKEELYMIHDKLPNRTHTLLASLEKYGNLKAVITQNIDNLHQKAGNVKVVELHGSIENARCLSCGNPYTLYAIQEKLANMVVPLCDRCQGLIKPNIVFFGESLDTRNIEQAVQLCSQADIFLVMGSSLVVYPAASLPIIAKKSGALLGIVNREVTPEDYLFDYRFRKELQSFTEEALGYIRNLKEKS